MLKSLGIKEPGDYMIDPLKIKNNFHVYSATAVTKKALTQNWVIWFYNRSNESQNFDPRHCVTIKFSWNHYLSCTMWWVKGNLVSDPSYNSGIVTFTTSTFIFFDNIFYKLRIATLMKAQHLFFLMNRI